MFRFCIKCTFVLFSLVFVASLQIACSGGNKTTCNPACAADEECKSGTCQKKAACNPACAADEECLNNACQKKAACNPACAADEECKSGTCQKKAACNPACAADEECKSGTCQKKAVCNPACAADEECLNNACQKKSAGGGVGSACNATDKPCTGGLSCLSTSKTESHCFEKCTADADCKDSFRNTCIIAGTDSNNQPIMICLARSAKGGECGYTNGPKQGVCQSGQNPPLYCDTTTYKCSESTVQTNEGDACNKAEDRTQPPKICDASVPLTCDQATGTCKKATFSKEGEPCNTTDTNGTPLICATGMGCIRFSNGSRCQIRCDPKGTSAECTTAGTSCLPLLSDGGGMCMDNQCSSDDECAFADYACRDSNGDKLCLPKTISGPQGYTGLCKDPPAQFGCDTKTDPKSFCLRLQDGNGKLAPQGYCSKDCTDSDRCPEWSDRNGQKAQATCTTINNSGTKACLFSCSKPGEYCPTGLTCQSYFAGTKFCLAPPLEP